MCLLLHFSLIIMIQYCLTHTTSVWKKWCVATWLTFARARHENLVFPISWFSKSFFLCEWHIVSLLSKSIVPAGALQFVVTDTSSQAALYATAIRIHVAEENVGWKTRTRSISQIDRVPLRDKHSNPPSMALKSLSIRRDCDDDNVKSL